MGLRAWFCRRVLKAADEESSRTAELPRFETESAEKLRQAAEAKYERLYLYANELLKEELDRFNRADEKAARLGTTFVFLVGAAAFFDKLICDKLLPPRSNLEWALVVIGALTLVVSFIGWFMANWVGRMRGYSRLPLNEEVFGFFDQQPLLNFYGSFSKNIEEAFQANVRRTNQKHAVLVKAFYVAVAATLLLVTLVSLYGLYSWKNPGKFDAMGKHGEEHPPSAVRHAEAERQPSPAGEAAPLLSPPVVIPSDLPKPDWDVIAPKLSLALNSQPLREPKREAEEPPKDD